MLNFIAIYCMIGSMILLYVEHIRKQANVELKQKGDGEDLLTPYTFPDALFISLSWPYVLYIIVQIKWQDR